MWPGFNRKSFSSFPVKQFKPMALKMASQLGIHLQARPYDGAEGLALRGFYVERGRSALKRALVFVNTSHHAGAVNTTFCHEIAHHLTSRFFETSPVPVHFFFDSDYSSHLDDPAELAADVMCCIAGYPEPLARDFFSMPWTRGLVAKADKLPDVVFHRVLKHITKRYGLDLSSRISVNQRLNYLAGMVHYAKLRWALLEEYDL